MAWRVSREPDVSWAMEWGWPPESLATSARRVGSPSAAKTYAWARRVAALLGLGEGLHRLRCGEDIGIDVLHLLGPAAAVAKEGFGAAFRRNVLEAGLDDGEDGCAV